MKKNLLTILTTVVLLGLAATAAYAATATVSITGGSLSVSPANVSLSAVTLDGTDKTATSAAASNTWTVTDARGTGAGWNVTVVATDFSDGGTPTRTLNISAADSQFKIQLLGANIAVTAGNTAPTSSVTTLTAIPESPAAAVKIASAAVDAGMGTYTLKPNFELGIPAETYVGTGSYTATVTISVATGP